MSQVMQVPLSVSIPLMASCNFGQVALQSLDNLKVLQLAEAADSAQNTNAAKTASANVPWWFRACPRLTEYDKHSAHSHYYYYYSSGFRSKSSCVVSICVIYIYLYYIIYIYIYGDRSEGPCKEF